MAKFTNVWNAGYEAIPADTEQESLGAARIRDLKVEVRQRMAIQDHSWAGDDSDGYHISATLLTQAADPTPTPASGTAGVLYSKLIGGHNELFWKDDVPHVLQLTSAGSLVLNGAAGGVLAGTYPNPGFANINGSSFLANTSGGAAAPTSVSFSSANVAQLLAAFIGDSGAGGARGAVPVPTSGQGAAGLVLRADGTWGVPFSASNISANPGYVKLAGGLVIQWGLNTGFSNSYSTVNFAVSFPTTCVAVVATIISGNTGTLQNCYVDSIGVSSFRTGAFGAGATNVPINWIAIGF